MSSSLKRPTIAPAVLAALLDLLPARLRRRYDMQPGMAEGWAWNLESGQWRVVIDDDTKVDLMVMEVTDLAQVRCTCLLSPRCLHVAACLGVLETADAPIPDEAPTVEDDGVIVTASHHQVAQAALEAVGSLLTAGAAHAGALTQAVLLRALYDARIASCHRLAGAMARVLASLRRLRTNEAVGDDLMADLRELVIAALALLTTPSGQHVGRSVIGSARRIYRSVGSGLRLTGWLSEPLLTRGGYAGVITHLVDAQGRRWTLPAMRPGGVEQVAQAWEGGAGLGDLSLSHRDLARGGCVVQDATASNDGRLGAGAVVKAVSTTGLSWDESPLAEQFARPLAEQVSAAFAALADPEAHPVGDLLIAVIGEVVGADEQAVHLATNQARLRLTPPSWDPRLPYVSNLERLALASGMQVRVVGRLVAHQPGTLEVLAIGTPGKAPTIRLPTALAGRLLLGLEHLPGAALPASSGRLPALSPTDDPWGVAARRLQGVVLGGRMTLSGRAAVVAEREAVELSRGLSPHAATLLRGLIQACGSTADRWGRLVAPPALPLARAWAALAIQLDAARLNHARSLWMELLH